MMVGTASLPHILMRYFTTPSVREARQSVAWSLLFIFLLYFSAPAYAAFSKLEVYTNIIGRDLTAIRPWLFTWGELGLIQICGKNAASIDAIVAACKAIAGHPGVVRLQDFVINTDVIVLSTPEIAGLPYVISGLVAAGGLAAALSTADGLLLAIANALSHDIYYKMIDPNAPTIRRLTVARVLLCRRRRGCGGTGRDQTGRHPGHGRLGVLAGHGRQLPGAGDGRLVETHDRGRRDRRHRSPASACACSTSCVSRYFPGFGVKYFGMTSLLNPVTGAPVVDIAKAMALPNAMETWPTLAHPLANKVGWFNLNNINCGLLGMPIGFLVIYRRQPDRQGAVEGNAGLRRRDPQAARPDGARGEDRPDAPRRTCGSGASGPRFHFAAPRRPCPRDQPLPLSESGATILGHRHITCDLLVLPSAELRAGGVDVHAARPRAARPDGRRGFAELHLAILLPDHRSGHCRRVAAVTPKAAAPVVLWLFSFVWLFWLRVALHYTLLLLNLAPRARSRVMSRNFYFIGIAFFGMINGIFNQLALVFALLYVQPLAGPLLFGSVSLTLMFASLMVSTATVILGGIPAAIYERLTGASRLERCVALDLARGHGDSDPARDRQFLRIRPLSRSRARRHCARSPGSRRTRNFTTCPAAA